MDDDIRKLLVKIEGLEREIQELKREIGFNRGEELGRQIDKIMLLIEQNHNRTAQIERDVTAIRRTVEFGDQNLKEIQQALALIYRNTDELESNSLGGNRETR